MIRKIICSIAAIWIPSNSWSTEIRNLKVNFANIFATKLFLFLLPNSKYSANQVQIHFRNFLNTPHQSYILECLLYIFILIFVFSTRQRSPVSPFSPSRSINLWWNSISPVSVVSHPAPNSTLQGSKLHRLSLIDLYVYDCVYACVSCVWLCISFASLTIDRLAFELFFYCCCMGDMRYTIYTRQSILSKQQQQFP